MVTNRTTRFGLMAIAFIGAATALSGCQVASAEETALADISSHLNEIRAAVNDKLVTLAPDEAFRLDPAVVHDLRGLTADELRGVGAPFIYALEQSPDYLGVDLLVVGTGNEGGFSNANRSFYSCVLIEGVPGVGESQLVDRECPQEIIDEYVYSYTAVKLSQLDV
ncbi:hypothetical protein [Cryobacterium aureum]|uniref:hypothetical protein n=1 Tax=Cryobacterium aureum TaxID=995037 RepID=UPI000CF4A30E|nr:hypothetical protein [Cryobacterium aureum]